jgi:hypothetical protein
LRIELAVVQTAVYFILLVHHEQKRGLKRAEVKLPGLVLRVTANEVLNEGQSVSVLKVIDSAVSMSEDGFFTMVFLDAGESGGGQLYEATCVLKTLLRSRAHLLVAECVDIVAASRTTDVVLSDQETLAEPTQK